MTKSQIFSYISSLFATLAGSGNGRTAIVTTANAAPTVIDTITPANSSVTIVKAFVCATTANGATGVGYELTATFRKSNVGVVTIVGAVVSTVSTQQEDGALAAASANIAVNASGISVTVTGVNPITMNWRSYMQYTTVTI